MNAGSERHSGIHHNPEASLGRRIVAPLRRQKEPASYFHRLQQIARRLHPVALFLFALPRAREEFQQRRPVAALLEKRAHRQRIQLHDAGRALFPQLGDQHIAIIRVAIDFERKHAILEWHR